MLLCLVVCADLRAKQSNRHHIRAIHFFCVRTIGLNTPFRVTKPSQPGDTAFELRDDISHRGSGVMCKSTSVDHDPSRPITTSQQPFLTLHTFRTILYSHVLFSSSHTSSCLDVRPSPSQELSYWPRLDAPLTTTTSVSKALH